MILNYKTILKIFKYAKALIKKRYYKFKNIDNRRFWIDGDVNSSANIKNFIYSKHKLLGITFKSETRDSAILNKNQSITIKGGLDKNTLGVRIGFAYRNLTNGNTNKNINLKIFKEGKSIAHITSLPDNEWVDLKLKNSINNKNLKISNSSDKKIIVSSPAFVQKTINKDCQNIIVIVLDSFTNDIFKKGFYENSSITPNIYEFFKDSHIYSNAFSIAEWTLPSIYSMLSAEYPSEHGFFDLNQSVPKDWSQRSNTLPVILKNQGFQTFACSTAKVFTPAFGGHSGFDRFFYDKYPISGRNIHSIVGRAIEQLEANKEGKNFLFLHIIDTHEPWTSRTISENCNLPAKNVGDPIVEYDNLKLGLGDSNGEPIFNKKGIKNLSINHKVRMKNVDLYLSLFFNYLEANNFLDNSNIILTGDHGTLYNSGYKPLLNKGRTHIPLLVRKPNSKKIIVNDLINTGLDFKELIESISLGNSEGFKQSKDYFQPSPIRNFLISESIFGDKYKICVRNKKLELHIKYRFNIKTKKIDLKNPLQMQLFNSKGESISPFDYDKNKELNRFLKIVKMHISNKKSIFKN